MIEFEHLFPIRCLWNVRHTFKNSRNPARLTADTDKEHETFGKEFGVILFARSKNHIALNENGLLAIKEARKILSEIEVMTDKVRQLDRSRHTLSLGSCAPILSWTLYG